MKRLLWMQTQVAILTTIAITIIVVTACADRNIGYTPLGPTPMITSSPFVQFYFMTAESGDATANVRVPPKPTARSPWKRVGAEETAVAACPEGTTPRGHIRPDPLRDHWGEFVTRYPHGIVKCIKYGGVDTPGGAMPGFSIMAVTPMPKGEYLPNSIFNRTITPTPTPKPIPARWTRDSTSSLYVWQYYSNAQLFLTDSPVEIPASSAISLEEFEFDGRLYRPCPEWTNALMLTDSDGNAWIKMREGGALPSMWLFVSDVPDKPSEFVINRDVCG